MVTVTMGGLGRACYSLKAGWFGHCYSWKVGSHVEGEDMVTVTAGRWGGSVTVTAGKWGGSVTVTAGRWTHGHY